MIAPPADALLILGPTASGKSGLALTLAQQLNGVVINADSRQLYRDLRILTARPSAAEEAAAPHRLYGILGGAEVASAMRWRTLAEAEMAAAAAAGRLPIITGGTGFYIRALLDGFADIPDVPDAIRDEVNAEVAEIGPAAAHARLAAVDPALAATLRPSDPQRIARGLAVFRASGRPLSDWQATPRSGPPPGWRFHITVLEPARAALYAACDSRLAAMFEDGALEEVAALTALNLPAQAPVLQSVGVPEILGYLAGHTDLATALARAQADTRHYAKRQVTWLRHQLNAHPTLRLPAPNAAAVQSHFPLIRK